MNAQSGAVPFIAVIDDDDHSAQLLTRTLASQGVPSVRHLGSPKWGGAQLRQMLDRGVNAWPDMVVVDIKAGSGGNAEFAEQHHGMLGERGIPLAVMSRPIGRGEREALIRAGASGVFFRLAERDAYRRETAGLLQFWARQPRLDTVGV